MTTRIDTTAIYTVAEAADAIGMSVTFVRKRIKSGEMSAHRLGATIRIKGSDLQSWFDGLRIPSGATGSCPPEMDGSRTGTREIADAALASAFRGQRQ